MPCGGIYPISDADPSWRCFHCSKPNCDHFCDEWDCGLHADCVIPFLHTDEGGLVLEHKHHIQIGMFILQQEDGELMDPNQVLEELRSLLRSAASYEGHDAFYLTGLAEEAQQKFEALDGWLSRGGFLPTEWKQHAR